MVSKDFLIVGGGVIGLASALAIRRSGASVAVVEAVTVGAGASWAGGGILSPLLPWEYPPRVAQLAARGATMYEAWVRGLREVSGRDSEFQRSGMVVLPPFDAELATQWMRDTQASVEFDITWLGRRAVFLPEVAQVRNPRLLAALLATARIKGVEVVEQMPVETLLYDGDRVRALRTARGDLRADGFVIAAGAWTPKLLPSAQLDIKPIRGQMLLFSPSAESLPNIVYRDGVYLIPRRDGQILVGSTREDVGFDCGTTDAAREQLHRAAVELWPALRQSTLLKHWAGLRPMRPDNAPIIGRHPNYKNLFINAGHGRYGLTMAPCSAEILLTQMGLTTSTDPLDRAFEIDPNAQLDKVQIVG